MSVNTATIVGHLGRDPELRYHNNTAVCRMHIATTRKYRDKQDRPAEETEWHRVTAWGKLAENCARYLTKGRQAYVQGRLRTSTYEKDGQTHYSTEIVAEDVQFLGARQETAP